MPRNRRIDAKFSSPQIRISPASSSAFALVVVACALVVHHPVASAVGLSKTLPPQVAEMRDMILTAVHTGQIEDLKSAIDLNGVKPDLGDSPGDDPITTLKAASADHEGREVLAILGEILEFEPAALPLGKDLENNLVYVWPYLAEKPLDQLRPPEEVALLRLVTPAKAAEMRDKKRWLWWRLAIDADGTWRAFKKAD
jgi:hypothetical protein